MRNLLAKMHRKRKSWIKRTINNPSEIQRDRLRKTADHEQRSLSEQFALIGRQNNQRENELRKSAGVPKRFDQSFTVKIRRPKDGHRPQIIQHVAKESGQKLEMVRQCWIEWRKMKRRLQTDLE